MLDIITDGRTDMVFDYVNGGNRVNTKDSNGTTLIQWCAYYGDVSAIKFLLSKGESLTSLGANFDLHGAAFHGHWRLCQFLLENGADAAYKQPDTFETALHAAFTKANRPAYNLIAKLLIAHGADTNTKTKPNAETGSFMRDARTRQETPLHRAAAYGNEESINLLLDAGADRTIKDMNGDSPLSWASWHLRPAKILSILCYGDYNIHPENIRKSVSDHGAGWGNGMEMNLLGKIHL